MTINTTHPARAALERWGAEHPGIWRLVDEARLTLPAEAPSYVFLPLGAARLAWGRWQQGRGMVAPLPKADERESWEPISALKQYASWRPTQGIYRFDPTLYEAIITTPVEGEIPAALLQRLPEWCVYVETSGLHAPLASGKLAPLMGFWATLEHLDEEDHLRYKSMDVLHVGLHAEGHEVAVNHLPLHGTLESSLRLLEEDWARHGAAPPSYVEHASKMFGPMLSLLLYLCSEASEIEAGDRRPALPQPKRTRHGLRLFPPDKPTVWGVGVRMGAALRRAYEAETTESVATGRRVRPHVRRAHWHTFLAGRRREERRVKWLPPIAVNLTDLAALPATIRPVPAQ
jgi:hypothetical protein